MKWFTVVLVVVALVVTSLSIAQQEQKSTKADVKGITRCPMHKDGTSAKSGDCSGMTAEKCPAMKGTKMDCAAKAGMTKGEADSCARKADCPKEKAK